MTREEAINMLYGIQADNLNLDDAYTKDKYDALTMAIKALEQEPCDDAISRAALKKCKQYIFKTQGMPFPRSDFFFKVDDVMALPPVKPQEPKTGHWLYKEITDDYRVTGQCSECKERRIIDNFCPNCGARMESEG